MSWYIANELLLLSVTNSSAISDFSCDSGFSGPDLAPGILRILKGRRSAPETWCWHQGNSKFEGPEQIPVKQQAYYSSLSIWIIALGGGGLWLPWDF